MGEQAKKKRTQTEPSQVDMAPVFDLLTKDVRAAAAKLTPREARYLVDCYYQSQENRKRAANQERAAKSGDEPSMVIHWLEKQQNSLEGRIKSILDAWSAEQKLGAWARSNKGIGPVISAGLLAHIDIAKAPTAGHIWSFAGLDPRVIWKGGAETKKELEKVLGDTPGEITPAVIAQASQHFRRAVPTIIKYAQTDTGKFTHAQLVKALSRQPWNAQLKTLCWKIGESFVKVSGKEDAFYGRLYPVYRAEEDTRNANGEYAEQARLKLERFKIGKSTDAYKAYSSGKLPPAHLFARAKRRVIKLFLSHYHEVGFEILHGKKAPRPWAIEHGGHTHYIPPPNWG